MAATPTDVTNCRREVMKLSSETPAEVPFAAAWRQAQIVIGRWSLVVGHCWSLVVGHWSLVIGRSVSRRSAVDGRRRHLSAGSRANDQRLTTND